MADATAGDIFAALFAAHQVADYWAQTERQAADKGLPGRKGQLACACHVATMTACKALALGALHASGRRVSPCRAVLALAADAASHYWADRRFTLARLAGLARHEGFYRLAAGKGCLGTGAAYMDQAWHVAWLWAASVIAGGAGDECA